MAAPPAVVVVRFILTRVPLHNTCGLVGFTCGVGFTTTVNVIGSPIQLTPALVNVGVTITVATFGIELSLKAINDGIAIPEPLINPILWSELVHE